MKDVASLINRPHFQPGGGVSDGIPPDPAIPTRIRVNLDLVVAYQGNPRKSQNPAYPEIKESIRNIGLQNAPNVTRVDPSHPYMIRDGGNTRLQILRELWEETGDRKYYEFDCMFHPYSNDLDLLIRHVIENEMRGGMILIERGLAAVEIKNAFESRNEKAYSNLALAKELKTLGWTIDDRTLGLALYATNELSPFIPKALWAGLGIDSIKRIRKLLDDCKTFWTKLPEHQEDPEGADLEFELLWQEVFAGEDDESFTITELQDALEGAIADYIGCPLMSVTGDIQAISKGYSKGGVRPESVLLEESLNPSSVTNNNSNNPPTTGNTTPNKSKPNTADKRQHAEPALKSLTAKNAELDKAAIETGEAKSRQETAEVFYQEPESNSPPLPSLESFSLDDLQHRAYSVAHQICGYLGITDLLVPGQDLAQGKPHVGYFLLKPEQNDYLDIYEQAPELRQTGNYYRYLFFLSCTPLTYVPPRDDTAPLNAMDLGWLTNWPTQVLSVRQLIEFLAFKCQYTAQPDPQSLDAVLTPLISQLEQVIGEILLHLKHQR